jgi:hypothetical protein
MKHPSDPRRSTLRVVLCTFAAAMLVGGSTVAAAAGIDESELQALGFKVLVATTPVQQEWVQRLPPGKVKAVQRNGNKYFIFPDASRQQVYVGGPSQYEAYQQRHPESQPGTEEAAKKGSDARAKQNQTMQKATARDESNPYLGIGWSDLIW